MDVTTVARFIRPEDLRTILRTNPGYAVNRERAGVLAHDGLAAYDAYQAAKPYLFWGSLIGMAISGTSLYLRRKRGPEAWWTYGTAFVACAGTAWVTRPSAAVPANATAGTPPSEDGGFVAWLDDRAKKLKAKDPAFADKAFKRLLDMPGFKESWDSTHPLIQATVV